MLSLEFIRRHPDLVKAGVAKKHDAAPIDEILGLDEERRRLLADAEQLKARRNEASKEIGRLMKQGPARAEQLRAEMRSTGDRIKELDAAVAEIEPRLQDLLLRVPNLPEPSVPVGKDESENVVRRHWGEPRRFELTPQPHWEIAERLGLVDFERGSKLSGSRFYVLRGLGARLERTLIDWMLDLHTREHGYLEIWPPYLVKPEAMLGTGQLPKFGEDMYHAEQDDLYLIPTAEVPLTNLHAGEILEPGTLPIRYVGFTPCFRREAGAAGRDTRGLVRVHQFDKVELVKFVEPATSYAELEGLIANAEEVLRRLGLPYRVTQMCTGDLGFAAAMKYDLEVWMPGQDRYVEISSCSNFEDFQARRAGIRYRPAVGARAELVHTLNGSALAIGRTFAALLENYQQADGTVAVPEVLRAMFGREAIQ